MKDNLLAQLAKVEQIANFSKLRRLLYNPYRYLLAILYRHCFYPIRKKIILIETDLFFGGKMKIALPASTDIYLTRGKSHSSEIRLAKFMIQHIHEGNHFLDIGAHYGYFTRLATELIGPIGLTYSFEPTSVSYKILSENCNQIKNISIFQKAVSNQKGNLVFYEFPNLHSEYNSFDITQFKDENWFQHSKPIAVNIEATTIDDILVNTKFEPNFIKIDVEGGELKVIEGGKNYLMSHAPILMMEYLAPDRNNQPHSQALQLLLSMNYQPHIIQNNGELHLTNDIDNYLSDSKLESDNIVFVKL